MFLLQVMVHCMNWGLWGWTRFLTCWSRDCTYHSCVASFGVSLFFFSLYSSGRTTFPICAINPTGKLKVWTNKELCLKALVSIFGYACSKIFSQSKPVRRFLLTSEENVAPRCSLTCFRLEILQTSLILNIVVTMHGYYYFPKRIQKCNWTVTGLKIICELKPVFEPNNSYGMEARPEALVCTYRVYVNTDLKCSLLLAAENNTW